MKKLADGLFRIHRGRDAIGWVRRDGDTWMADAKGKRATGHDAGSAFHELVRIMNNDYARRQGFDDARQMVEARNREVQEFVDTMNKAAGMPVFRVRRRRIRV